jgi:hypothetical protein
VGGVGCSKVAASIVVECCCWCWSEARWFWRRDGPGVLGSDYDDDEDLYWLSKCLRFCFGAWRGPGNFYRDLRVCSFSDA